MYAWVNKIEDLIGFNPGKLLVISCIITGVAFPFIFLNQDLESYLSVAYISVLFGVIYAVIISYGNAYIFYKGKTRSQGNLNVSRTQSLHQSAIKHFIFTVIVSTILGFLGTTGLEGSGSIGYIIRNIVGSLLLSSLIVIFFESFYFMHELRRAEQREEVLKRQNAESQLEILKNQVKPHFLFNSLNTVVSIIPDEPQAAIDYIQRLSKVYRYILEIKDQNLIPLSDELDCITDYVHMLQIRFGDNLHFELNTDNISEDHHIVPLSLQLLVENAVKHNIISNKKPLKINIHKGKNGSLLVSNNLQPKVQKMPSTGTGLENIKSRYEMLTKQSVDIIQTQDQFTVSIPLIQVA